MSRYHEGINMLLIMMARGTDTQLDINNHQFIDVFLCLKIK